MSCSDYDITVYREVENPGRNCLMMHFVQGVSTALAAKDFLEGVENPTDVQHDKFCEFINKKNSSRPMDMFTSPHYDIDAIVRHMFFLQLSEYKPCTRILDCPGGPYDVPKCTKGYKFHISMVSERAASILIVRSVSLKLAYPCSGQYNG
jgi:hypothetical protein